MSSLRIAALTAATTAVLVLPGSPADALTGGSTGRVGPAQSASRVAWGAHVKLPDGSTARFSKSLRHPEIKITSKRGGSDDSTTLDEEQLTGLHDGWLFELGDGPCLKVTDGGTGREWKFDFHGKLLDDSAVEHI